MALITELLLFVFLEILMNAVVLIQSVAICVEVCDIQPCLS
jgi:hypothetical protein